MTDPPIGSRVSTCVFATTFKKFRDTSASCVLAFDMLACSDVQAEQIGSSEPVLTRYDEACFPDRMPQAELEELGKKYNRGWRQIRRWISLGRETGDQCPARDPWRLLQWWRRRMKHQAPAEIIRLAIEASSSNGASASQVPFQVEPPINLQDIEAIEGEHVKQVRRLAQALYNQLELAYLRGGPDIDSISRRYEKSLETLRKLEVADREAQRLRGSLVSVARVEQDAAIAAGMLRTMREAMTRRVIEQCSFLDPEARAKVANAIEKARKHEERIFCDLSNLRSKDDFDSLFAFDQPLPEEAALI